MSALPNSSQADAAAAYERYISENWDSLQPFEQEQARSYLQAKFQEMQMPQPQLTAPAMSPQPGFPSATPGYAYGYGYGPGAFGPPKKEEEGEWAIWAGYVGLLVFTPLAVFCGIYNLNKGRIGHGLVQLLIPVGLFIFVLMVVAAGP